MSIQDSDIPFLVAALQNAIGLVEIDGQKLAEQLGLSISSIPPKFTNIRKRYNLNIKVSNTGTIRRSRRSTAIVARPTNIDSKEGDDMDPPSQSAA